MFAAVALYYKSAKDQFHYHSDARFYAPHKPGWMAPYARMLHNNGFEEQRGLEFSLSKSFTNNFAFNLSYNLTDAQAAWGNWDAWFNFMYPDSTYIASGRYWYEFTVQNGQEVPVPLTEEQNQGDRAHCQQCDQKQQESARQARRKGLRTDAHGRRFRYAHLVCGLYGH